MNRNKQDLVLVIIAQLASTTKREAKRVVLIVQAAQQDFIALDVECHRGRLLVLVWPALQASSKARQVPGILSVQIVLYAQPTPFIILYHVVQYHQGLVNVLKDTTGTVMNVNHVR